MLGREYVPEKEAIAVEVGLTNGDLLKGRLWVPPGKSLADALNTAQTFLEFTPYGEEHPRYVAKGQIISLKIIDVPKSVPLYERRGASGADDPHQILAVAPGAPGWPCARRTCGWQKRTIPTDFPGWSCQRKCSSISTPRRAGSTSRTSCWKIRSSVHERCTRGSIPRGPVGVELGKCRAIATGLTYPKDPPDQARDRRGSCVPDPD